MPDFSKWIYYESLRFRLGIVFGLLLFAASQTEAAPAHVGAPHGFGYRGHPGFRGGVYFGFPYWDPFWYGAYYWGYPYYYYPYYSPYYPYMSYSAVPPAPPMQPWYYCRDPRGLLPLCEDVQDGLAGSSCRITTFTHALPTESMMGNHCERIA